MAEDMQVRNFSPRTIDSYTYHVDRYAKHFGKHPEQLGPEDVRNFQLWMIREKKSSWSQFNQAVCGLRFFYSITCKREWVVSHIPFGHVPKKLPNVLGSDEVAKARINKHVTPHTLRHSYATGLLEAGVDLMAISKLLGHSSFTTTMVYLHCRKQHLSSTPSPLDWLPVKQCPLWVDPSLQTDLPKSKPSLPIEPMPPQLEPELPPELQPPQQEQQPTVRRGRKKKD